VTFLHPAGRVSPKGSDMNMKRMVYAVIGLGLLALLLAGIVWAVVGRGGGTTSVTADPLTSAVEDAREFDEFPVYWLGESFQGLPLVRVTQMDYPGHAPGTIYNLPWHEVGFIYGNCTIAPGESSCPVPLTIAVRPYCEVPPEVVLGPARTEPPEEIRGALVHRMGRSQMQVWTSNVSISINATDPAIDDAAAQNLVRLNGDKPSSPEEPLGPPDQIECPPPPWSIMPSEHATETTRETTRETTAETTTECYRSGTPIPCPNVTPSPGVPTPRGP
jgi:hypothetical protein